MAEDHAEEPDLDVCLPSFHPVAREMLHEQVFAMLRDNLMLGRFAPGQKLPLRGLAKVMGTSLMPVRDALQRLESLGVLQSSTNNRTLMVPVLSQKEQEDLIHLRVILESESAGGAALRRRQVDVDTLAACCIQIMKSSEAGDLPGFLEANYHFHMRIAQASGISFLPALLEPLWMRVGPLVRDFTPDRDHMLKSVSFHERIRDAIAAKDADMARKAMIADIIESNAPITPPAMHPSDAPQ